MKCPFCERPIKIKKILPASEKEVMSFVCTEDSCFFAGDCPRYLGILDQDYKIVQQEYQLGNFYAKVFQNTTLIYRLNHCFLEDEVSVPRALWLNPINTDETLDKLKFCVTFS